MNRPVRQAVLVVVAVSAFAGCHYAKTETPPPPPPPAQLPEPTCASVATLTYDPSNATHPLTVSAKPITVGYPSGDASKWAICWYLVVQGSDPDPFDQMRLEDFDGPTGRGGRSLLTGDSNFQGRGFVKMSFNDEPNWPTASPQQVVVSYKVVGRLRGAAQNLSVDPDVVIQKR